MSAGGSARHPFAHHQPSAGYDIDGDDLMDAILDNPDGFTLSSDQAVSPATGIAVALDHTPLTYSSGAFAPDGSPTDSFRDDINDWIEAHEDMIEEYGGLAWIGGWCDPATGESEVNLTVVFRDDPASRAAALVFAAHNDQKSVYDIAAGETIGVGGSGGAAWRSRSRLLSA